MMLQIENDADVGAYAFKANTPINTEHLDPHIVRVLMDQHGAVEVAVKDAPKRGRPKKSPDEGDA